MTALVVAPKFEEHFWGAENKGFDVLLQNYKVGLGASKELNEFIKERLIVEDSYVKGLTKLSKNMTALPNASAGSLSPMWQVLHSMCTQLSAAHSQFIQLLQDLSREVSDYSIAQKEKMKANMKGEIEGTQDSLRLLETQDTSLQRAKKLYTQSVEQLIKLQNKVEKTKGEANPKTRQQLAPPPDILSTPPSERKNTSLTSAFDPATSSLLDSDISLSPSVGMAAPLQPLSVASLSSDPTEPLPVMMWSQQPAPLLPSPFTPPTSIALPSLTGDSTSGSPDNTKKPVPKPRRTSTGTHQGPADSPLEETAPKKNSPSELAKDGDVRIQVPMSGWSTGYSSDEELPVAQPTFPIFDSPRSDSSGSLSDPDTQTVGMLSPPRHNPRKNTRQRGTTPEQQALSPLVTSQISASPPATGATSPVLPVTPNTSLPTVQDTSPAVQGVPLAVAFQEVCNAMFKSHDPSDCMVKITGEMVVSFPASLLGKLETYSRICFKLKGTDKLKQVLHNQILLTRNWDDEGFSYSFNTPALSAHLASMASKRTAPFYNMQLIKYEVDVTDGKLLPVRLAAFWKCTETITNFRFDYTYIGGNLPTSKRPTINQLTICVPVNGGVRNTLSKPSGNWLSDTQQLIWTISDIEASDNETPTSIHAKFDVSQGPSTPQPVTVKFGCDGSTVSGIGLELMGTDFRVSLLKNKFSSGKYSAEMRYTP